MTILEALQKAESALKERASENTVTQNAKLDAQVLLAHVLEKGTAYLFAHGDEALSTKAQETFEALIARRAAHEPVAYLLREKEFFGRSFFVTPDVLIPRPATETMIEAALKTIDHRTTIIDVGTGSGAIGLTLAAETARPVILLDASEAALSVARKNAEHLIEHDRLLFLAGHLLTPIATEAAADDLGEHVVMTANLPYLSLAEWEKCDPDVRNFEPTTALVSGLDGLDHYLVLFTQLARWRNQFPKRLDCFVEIETAQKERLEHVVGRLFPTASTILHQAPERTIAIVEIALPA